MNERAGPNRQGDGWDPDGFSGPPSSVPRSWEGGHAGDDDPEEFRQAEPAIEVQISESEEKPKGRRGIIVVTLIAILAVPVVFWMAAVPPAPAEAAATEEVVEDERPAPPPSQGSTARSAPAPRSSGGYYRASGDISDIFCRPRETETAEEWSNRVPAHCLSRYSAPRR